MELVKLVIRCRRALEMLDGYLEHNEIDMPFEFCPSQIREWFLVAQGFAECIEKFELAKEKE